MATTATKRKPKPGEDIYGNRLTDLRALPNVLAERLDLLEGRIRALEVLLGDKHKVRTGELDGLDTYPSGELDNNSSGGYSHALGVQPE